MQIFQLFTSRIMVAGLLLGCPLTAAATQPSVPSSPSAPSKEPTKRFRIYYGITDAEYRQQALALTPLGSTYEQVRAFAQQERRARKSPTDNIFYPELRRFHRTQKFLDICTTLRTGEFYQRIDWKTIAEQPPHAKGVSTKYGFVEGSSSFVMFFDEQPFRLASWIDLGVEYVFDARHRLIDIYCRHSGFHPELPFATPPT